MDSEALGQSVAEEGMKHQRARLALEAYRETARCERDFDQRGYEVQQAALSNLLLYLSPPRSASPDIYQLCPGCEGRGYIFSTLAEPRKQCKLCCGSGQNTLQRVKQ